MKGQAREYYGNECKEGSVVSLTLPQQCLGLVRVEVFGLNEYNQEAVGSREIADGQKDLPSSCRRLLKQRRR